MTKLEWCKEHAPSSLIGASEIEILAAMSPFYDDYLSYTKQYLVDNHILPTLNYETKSRSSGGCEWGL